MHKVVGRDVGPSNTFLEGNPSSGKEGTEIPAAWLNDVQEEITGIPFVLEGAAPTSDNKQAGNAIKRAIANLDSKSTSAVGALRNETVSSVNAAKAEALAKWGSPYSGDLNAIAAAGVYHIQAGATNHPAGATLGGLVVMHSGGSTQFSQMAYSTIDSRIWTRYKSSSWGAWSELWHTGNQNCNTLWNELAKGYNIWHAGNTSHVRPNCGINYSGVHLPTLNSGTTGISFYVNIGTGSSPNIYAPASGSCYYILVGAGGRSDDTTVRYYSGYQSGGNVISSSWGYGYTGIFVFYYQC